MIIGLLQDKSWVLSVRRSAETFYLHAAAEKAKTILLRESLKNVIPTHQCEARLKFSLELVMA